MKPACCLALAFIAAGLSAAEMIPIEDFARPPAVSHLRLSPDGQSVAFEREFEGRESLFLTDLKSRRLSRVRPATAQRTFEDKDIGWFQWAGDRRLVFSTLIWDHFVTGVSAVDVDGRRWKTISGSEARVPNEDRLFAQTLIHVFDDADQDVLMLDQHEAEGARILHPNVVKVSTITGHYTVVARNPGQVVAWDADADGVVRLARTVEGLKEGLIYRENDTGAWRPFQPLGPERGEVWPLGFEGTGPQLYVTALSDRQRWGVYACDIRGGGHRVLLEDADYDILPRRGTPTFDGTPLAHAVFSRPDHRLVGIYYVTDRPVARWFDPEFAAAQRAIDRALPGTCNLLVGQSRDDSLLLVLAYSDRDPGTYFLYDRRARSLILVATRMKWIDPARMAPMEPITYSARDGVLIHGYLTRPPGESRAKLPLVVLPHGGPWMRDVWGFDPLVQMLASRGYAVLQMNFRGSTGYGGDLAERGRREVGNAIQRDVEDGARWTIAQGIADPRRIAILGDGFGGYSALYALGNSAGLYRCGVSISGITDWPAIYATADAPERRIARQYWIEQIGDPKTDAATLRAISPVNFADRILSPVLFFLGR